MKAIRFIIGAATFFACMSGHAQAQNSDKFPLPDSTVASGRKSTEGPNQSPPAQAMTGTLAIKAVQGSPNGRPIGAADVEIELFHRGMLYDTIKTKLDDHGVVMIENLPVAMGFDPVVRVYWADLSYQVTGALMDAVNPQQKVEVVCYEPTEEAPTWKVLMRHVMLADTKEGLSVTEVIVLENPAEQTWIGWKAPGNSKRMTTSFKLPAGATNVSLGRGFHEWCCSTLNNGVLVNHLPLTPGKTEMVFGYVIPARKGKADVDLALPASPGGIDHMMVIVPDSLKTEGVRGMEVGGTPTMNGESVRYYMASRVEPNQSPVITLAGLRGGGPAIAASKSESFAKIFALLGGGAVLLIAFIVVLLKGKRTTSTPPIDSRTSLT